PLPPSAAAAPLCSFGVRSRRASPFLTLRALLLQLAAQVLEFALVPLCKLLALVDGLLQRAVVRLVGRAQAHRPIAIAASESSPSRGPGRPAFSMRPDNSASRQAGALANKKLANETSKGSTGSAAACVSSSTDARTPGVPTTSLTSRS